MFIKEGHDVNDRGQVSYLMSEGQVDTWLPGLYTGVTSTGVTQGVTNRCPLRQIISTGCHGGIYRDCVRKMWHTIKKSFNHKYNRSICLSNVKKHVFQCSVISIHWKSSSSIKL